jgi:membrane protease YdiL (CAAX protease family)
LTINNIIVFISEWLGVISVAWLLGLSPRFRKPQVGFRYARRDGLMALSLSVVIIIFSYLFYSKINPPAFVDPLYMSPAPVHNLTQALILAALCLTPFVIALLVRQQPIRSIGWNPTLITPGLQMGVAMAILTIFLRNRVMDVLGGLSTPVLGALPIALGVALAEETIFRGYIQMRLVWWLGFWPGIMLTSALFTLWHLSAWLPALPMQTILILSGLTFVQSLVLGWVMRKSGSVVTPILYRAISIWVSLIG